MPKQLREIFDASSSSSLTEGTTDEFDELTQTIDHVTFKSTAQDNIGKAIENRQTSYSMGKSVSEKTVEKTLPDESQPSQVISLTLPPLTATAAGGTVLSEGTAVSECSDTVGVLGVTEGTPIARDETTTRAPQLCPEDSDDSDDVMVLHESCPRSSTLQLVAMPKTEEAHPVRNNNETVNQV